MREEKTVGLGRNIELGDDTPERCVDVRLAVQVLRDLGRLHAAGEHLASLDPEVLEVEYDVAAEAFDQAMGALDEYSSGLLLALAGEVQRALGALPGSELEHEALPVRGRA